MPRLFPAFRNLVYLAVYALPDSENENDELAVIDSLNGSHTRTLEFDFITTRQLAPKRILRHFWHQTKFKELLCDLLLQRFWKRLKLFQRGFQQRKSVFRYYVVH